MWVFCPVRVLGIGFRVSKCKRQRLHRLGVVRAEMRYGKRTTMHGGRCLLRAWMRGCMQVPTTACLKTIG